MMSDWQSIETAPERKVISVRQHNSEPMKMSREGDHWFWEPEHVPSSVTPTHWMES